MQTKLILTSNKQQVNDMCASKSELHEINLATTMICYGTLNRHAIGYQFATHKNARTTMNTKYGALKQRMHEKMIHFQ